MTKSFPFATSSITNPGEAARELGQTLASKSSSNAFGILYATSGFAQHIDAILETHRATTGIDAWTGAVGLGIIAGAREYFEQPALAAMLIELPENSFQMFGPVANTNAFQAVQAQAQSFASPRGTVLGLIHIDPTGDPSGNGIASLPSELAATAELFLVGGLASGQDEMPAIFSGGEATGAITGAFVSLDQGISTGVSQGCTPIGPIRQAKTAGVGVLSHLGSESAVEALLKDIGLSENSRPEELRNALNGLHVAFPIKGADRQDYLVRNITGIDLAQGLIGVAEAAEDGARVFFCRRDKQSAAKDLKDMAFKATKRLGKPARGAIYISCLARGPNLFGPNSEEIAIVKEAIGENVPVVGFFANGEIAHDRLYGYTGVLTLFG